MELAAAVLVAVSEVEEVEMRGIVALVVSFPFMESSAGVDAEVVAFAFVSGAPTPKPQVQNTETTT